MNINTIRSNIDNFYKQKRENYERTRNEKRNSRYSKYYQNSQWKNLRALYYAKHPICECCERQGIIRQTDDIHHKRPFLTGGIEKEKYSLLLDYNNLLAVCQHHHLIGHQYLREQNKLYAGIDEILEYEQYLKDREQFEE